MRPNIFVMVCSYNNDVILISKISRGDKKAFDFLYEKYWLYTYQYAFNLTRNEKDAEDLVQDLFFEIWQKRNSVVIKTSLKAYLTSAIKYKLLDKIRRNKLFETYAQDIAKSVSVVDEYCPEKKFIIGESIESLMNTIYLLPDKCRQIVYMNRFQQYSIQEISFELQLSQQTVKNQISKGLKFLRKFSGEFIIGLFSAFFLIQATF